MRIDFCRRAISLLCLLTVLCALTGCGSRESGPVEDATRRPTVASTVSSSTAPIVFDKATAHFPKFELDVPSDWTVRGNVGKVYEGNDMFLLAGPLEDVSGMTAVEQALAEELELFFNTEYYRNQVRFDYEKEYTDGAMHRLSGTLHNERNGQTLRFAGAFGTAPGMYCYYFWPDASRDRDGERFLEATYESIRIL